MKKYSLLFRLFLVLLVIQCNSYRVIPVKVRTYFPSQLKVTGTPDTIKENENFVPHEIRYCESPRYLSTRGSSRSFSVILSRGADEVAAGNTIEAEILFMELAGREKNGSVENNLAVICELNSDYNRAFELYIAAMMADPGNTYYEKNFYYFLSASNSNVKNKSKTD